MSATHDPWGLPEARVLRDGPRPVPRRRLGRMMRDFMMPGPRGQIVAAYLVGLWPLILVTGLALVLLWTAGLKDSP